MKRRTSSAAAAAFMATATLLLTACGSGSTDQPEQPGKAAGADRGSETTVAPAASASATGAPGRPRITVPPDMTETFAPGKTGDAEKDAILKDNAEFVRAQDAAIMAGDPSLPALQYYTEGEAAASSEQWVKSFQDNGRTITGTTHYYNRKVSVLSATTASLSYCGDESTGYTKIIKTGKVEKTPATKDSFVAYGAQVQKNGAGVWELINLASTRGADSCVR